MSDGRDFDAYVIEADGETAGIVVRELRGFRFYAVSNAFLALEAHGFRRPEDAQRAALDHARARRAGRSRRPSRLAS